MLDHAHDLAGAEPAALVAIGGAIIGLVFGYTVFRTNFCAMGAVADIVAMGDHRRMRAWVLAAAVAIAGSQLLDGFGYADLDQSFYTTPSLNWLAAIVGGVIFGFGMVLAGGCPSRNLVRAGGGDLRALIIIIIVGLSAYITSSGVLAPLRVAMEGVGTADLAALTGAAGQGLDTVVTAVVGPIGADAAMIMPTLVALGLAAYAFADPRFATSARHVGSGVVIGLCVTAGWAVTTWGHDDMDASPLPVQSLNFTKPMGDAMEYLIHFTGLGVPEFAITVIAGTAVGAFLAARLTKRFMWRTFADVRDTGRALTGACMMGTGGVMALGCTIGQALSGVSTLALGSFLTFGAIIAGGVWGVRHLERQVSRAAVFEARC